MTLPCLPPASSSLVKFMALAKTARFLASSSKASRLTVL